MKYYVKWNQKCDHALGSQQHRGGRWQGPWRVDFHQWQLLQAHSILFSGLSVVSNTWIRLNHIHHLRELFWLGGDAWLCGCWLAGFPAIGLRLVVYWSLKWPVCPHLQHCSYNWAWFFPQPYLIILLLVWLLTSASCLYVCYVPSPKFSLRRVLFVLHLLWWLHMLSF